MEEHSKQWYRQGLGPRVDSLEASLKLIPGDGVAAKHIRQIAESLRVSSASYGFDDIFAAARNTEEAPDSALAGRARTLVVALRAALAGQTAPRAVILLVSKPSTFTDELRKILETDGKEVVLATSATQAQEQLVQREFVFIVLDVVLPDQDGRQLLETIRSKPITAAIPIVVIAPRANDEIISRRLMPDVDGCFGKPIPAKQVADFILSHLRRAHEMTRDARRDPLTGLLNRAAFCEMFEHAVKLSAASAEPLTLVLLEVDGLSVEAATVTTPQSGHILQELAAVLSSSFRATDLVARWSPLQFAILFPGEDQFGAIRALEKAQHVLHRKPPAEGTTPTAFSCGLAIIENRMPLEQAMERTEHYLYLAKTHGGNRVVSADTKVARRKESVLISAQPEVVAVLKRILEVNGFEPIIASPNAEETLQQLTRSRFRLIVLEESAGGINGLGLLKRIRANAQFNRLPIIMLGTQEQQATQALDLGANDYMLKPFAPLIFIARIRHLLARGIKPQAGPRTLLLADADLTTLIVTGTALHKNAGMRVLLARTARDMLQRLEAEVPDILLLDAHLPDSGVNIYLPEVIRLSDVERTSIILTAAPTETQILEKLGGRDICGVLNKPFDLQKLIGELGDMLEIKLTAAKPDEAAAAHLKQEIQGLLASPTAKA